jgi:hypothetical protein
VEESTTRQSWDAKIPLTVGILAVVGFLIRAYPHLFLIPRWIIEETYNYQTVRDLIFTGSSPQVGFYPMFEHQVIYWVWVLTRIDPVTLSQYANPVFGALTAIPLYYVLRHYLSAKQSLLGCALWTFSEAAFYRTAYFGSTEALGFLLSLGALAAYQRKRYIFVAPLLLVGALSHLLPTAFITGVVFADFFLKAQLKQRLLILGVVIITIIVFFSPLNPHQRILNSITPSAFLKGFGSFGIYSAYDLLNGLLIFGGFAALAVSALIGWIDPPKSRLMMIYLALAAAVFIFSWVDYQPNIFAPPRLTFYFLVPFIYYSSRWVGVKEVAMICAVCLMASWYGIPTMLLTKNTATLEEFEALTEIAEMKLIGNPGWWLSDYPITTSLSLYATNVGLWETTTNSTALIQRAGKVRTAFNTTDFIYPYQYILISDRMLNEGGFFIENTPQRSGRVVLTVRDIWATAPLWSLIYEGHGVRVYHYEGKI